MGVSLAEAQAFFAGLSAKYGAGIEPNDVPDLMRRNPEDVPQVMRDFEAQYARRGASGQTGAGQDSTALSLAGVGNVQTAPAPIPPASAGHVVTMGPSAAAAVTQPGAAGGPTGQMFSTYAGGYGGGGGFGGLSMSTLLILAAVAAAAFYLLRK